MYGYSYLIAEIQDNIKRKIPISMAIDHAVTVCIEKGILAEYLNKHRAEVCTMIMTEYNEELHNQTLREEGRREGEDNLSRLYKILEERDRLNEFGKSMYDKEFLEKLKEEFGI